MRLPPLLVVMALVAGCNGGARIKPPGPSCPVGCAKCDDTGACHDCVAGQNACQGELVVTCNPDGTFGSTVKTCDTANNEKCGGGNCLTPCDVAASSHSYIGCDYWPTTTLTAQLNPNFDFAVAVANPSRVGDVVQSAPATVNITLGGTPVVAPQVVPPGEVVTIILPWLSAVSQNQSTESSVLVTDGAYHLVSTMPVTVYQFSPLEFEKPESVTCKDRPPNGNTCHSYTNDATILLPSTALKNDYFVMARQTFTVTPPQSPTSSIPGFFTIVGTQDKTNVNITFTAFTEAAINVSAQTPGSSASYMLDKGTVLEIISQRATGPCVNTSKDVLGSYCDLGPTYDVTGTRITADKPIAVFGGHSCSFVPYNKWACDHLEQQLFPLDTWGQKIVVVQTEPQTPNEANVFRVMSGSDNNQITFDPPVHGPVTLAAGKYIEFSAQGGFQASGTGRISIGQFMVGENATKDFGVDVGDPSMGQGVPVEQFRDNYDFLSPSTYTKNYVNLVAPLGSNLVLDGKNLPNGFSPIGASGYGYQRLAIMAGGHHITGDKKFSIAVSGVASFTSYLYVGGLNLNEIVVQ